MRKKKKNRQKNPPSDRIVRVKCTQTECIQDQHDAFGTPDAHALNQKNLTEAVSRDAADEPYPEHRLRNDNPSHGPPHTKHPRRTTPAGAGDFKRFCQSKSEAYFSSSFFSRKPYTSAAKTEPASGPTKNTQTSLIGAESPANAATKAGPKLLAGLTDVPVRPMPRM